MKIFDMHADIGTNLYERHLNGEKDVFKNYHINNLTKGDVKGVFTACYFSGTQDWTYMQEMIKNCNREINENLESLRQVKDKNDLVEDDKILTCISVEGMCGVSGNVEEEIEWMYQNNVRVASLVWNESNHLADGWPNNPLRGLSEEGFRVVKKMNELNMIIDVSHINEKGFWDIISTSSKPVIATHSNARNVCSHDRNLTNQQIKAIASKGGLIGLNSCGDFIDKERKNQTAYNLAKHARYMADMVGVEHVACGFDYMDFLIGYGNNDDNAIDLHDASMTQNLIEGLKECGFSEEEIEKIAFYNVYNFLKEQL